MRLEQVAGWVAVAAGVAAVASGLAAFLAWLIDGGPRCSSCDWTENQCSEAWHFSGRGCCSSCSHHRAPDPARDRAEYQRYLDGPIDPRD